MYNIFINILFYVHYLLLLYVRRTHENFGILHKSVTKVEAVIIKH